MFAGMQTKKKGRLSCRRLNWLLKRRKCCGTFWWDTSLSFDGKLRIRIRKNSGGFSKEWKLSWMISSNVCRRNLSLEKRAYLSIIFFIVKKCAEVLKKFNTLSKKVIPTLNHIFTFFPFQSKNSAIWLYFRFTSSMSRSWWWILKTERIMRYAPNTSKTVQNNNKGRIRYQTWMIS